MCQAGHYFRLDILLDIVPRLALLWGHGGKELPQIPWRDIGDHTAVLNGVVVVDD